MTNKSINQNWKNQNVPIVNYAMLNKKEIKEGPNNYIIFKCCFSLVWAKERIRILGISLWIVNSIARLKQNGVWQMLQSGNRKTKTKDVSAASWRC